MEMTKVSAVATPSPPFLLIEGVHNFRDIGGYALSDPNTSFRRHIIYRCGDPSSITDVGKLKISELGITRFFDLRSTPEIEKQPAVAALFDIPGVTRVFVPAFKDTDYSPERLATRFKDYAEGGPKGFTKAYADILANAAPAFRTILLHLRDRPGMPCVVHCTAGKDRTGVLVALLLSLAGASDATVAAEYQLTERGLAPLQPVFLEHVLSRPTFSGTREDALNMFSARAENMLAALQMIREVYGGAVGYVKSQCGLTDEDVQTIRRAITSHEVPIL